MRTRINLTALRHCDVASPLPVAPVIAVARRRGAGYSGEGNHSNGILRHRWNRPIDAHRAVASINIAKHGSHELTGGFPSSPSLSSTSSCSSDDFNFSERRAVTQARTLFGFPYPLLFCLLVSFVILPMQAVFNSIGDPEYLRQYSYLHRQQHHRSSADALRVQEQPSNIDAVVFVAVGPASASPVLGWSVHSIVHVGGWNGPIYIVTDRPEDVARTMKPVDTSPAFHSLRPENLHIIPHQAGLPPVLIAFTAKLTKCDLLHILPKDLKDVVYIDGDIIVGKPLASFWKSIAKIWVRDSTPAEDMDLVDDDVSMHDFNAVARQGDVSLGLFEDCKSYTAGFCDGCDTWNTGVMSISRGSSDSCLSAWCETLRIQGGTDQAALDTVIAAGSECQNIQALDRQHVRMMKDVFVVWGMVGTKTFNHFTGIFRPDKLAYVHLRFYERMLGKDLLAVVRKASR